MLSLHRIKNDFYFPKTHQNRFFLNHLKSDMTKPGICCVWKPFYSFRCWAISSYTNKYIMLLLQGMNLFKDTHTSLPKCEPMLLAGWCLKRSKASQRPVCLSRPSCGAALCIIFLRLPLLLSSSDLARHVLPSPQVSHKEMMLFSSRRYIYMGI